MDGLHKEIPKNKLPVQCEGLKYYPFARPSRFINLIAGFYSHHNLPAEAILAMLIGVL
jgi:hypothetical protein